jgi:hypothetical protein
LFSKCVIVVVVDDIAKVGYIGSEVRGRDSTGGNIESEVWGRDST